MPCKISYEVLQKNKPLSQHCTLGIGGPALYFTEVRTIDAMQETLRFCHQEHLPYIVLGKGSNCLFDDRGFHGLVISNKIDFIESPSPGIFHVGAGYSFSLLGAQTARQHWSGLEFASGIPASVGGAVFMNAGANGCETCDSLSSVDYVDEKGDLRIFHKAELAFSYRTSPFQKRRGAIVGATFALTPQPEARAKQLEIITYRKKTQPYSDPSAGCFFRNPVNGHAGSMIDQAGLKGVTIGGAKVSELHANFIINAGDAKAEDVHALVSVIRQRVHEKFGAELEVEVRMIPYKPEP